MTRLTRFLGSATLALATAACGTTVPLNAQGTATGDRLEAGAPTAPAGTADSSAANPGALGRVPNSASRAAGIAAAGMATQPGSVSPGSTASRQAVLSHAPIRVGVIYTPGLDAAASAIGIKGLSTGDTKAQAQAVVSWINAHGGLGGHPIQLYSYAMDMSASSPDAAQEAACTAMTQDYKVRYVITILTLQPVMMPCLAKYGVGMLDDETSLGDATMAKYAGFLANPGEIAPGREMSVMVEDLWNRGWLTSRSKIGILAADSTDGHAVVDGALAAALHRHGLKAVNTQYVNPNGGDGGSSQSSSAALRFRSSGVDRIIPVQYSPLYMMLAASNQHYYPAYALYSVLGPGALLETAAPPDQLVNSAGIGWQPFLDIGKGTKPGPVSARETLCFAIMKRAGQATTSATAEGFQVQICNVLFYLKDLSGLEPTAPPDLLASGRVLLGKNFVSADTFRTDVTHRTDGVAGYRSLAYETNCKCFQYVSPVRPTP
jgi:hypothetical protein